jgi:hypothetical protein
MRLKSIEASGRLAQARSQPPCHVREAMIMVDDAGAWRWQPYPAQTAATRPTRPAERVRQVSR